MDLEFSEAQEALVQSATDLLSMRASLDALADSEQDPRGPDDKLWPEMANLGWLGLTLSEDAGGSGGSFLDQELLCEVFGRSLVGLSYLATAVAAAAALEAAPSSVGSELLRGIAIGTVRPLLASADEHGRWSNPGALRWDGHSVLGATSFVTGAGAADVFLAAVGASDGCRLVAVTGGDSRVTVTHPPSMVGLCWSDVRFDEAAGVPLPGGSDAVERSLIRVAVMQAGWCAGAAGRLLEMTVAYASERRQFGVPIGSFQSVQHRLAGCATAIAEAQTLSRLAAVRLDQRAATARRLSSTVFVRAGKAFVSVARHCHQLWGDLGFCRESHVHHFSRRAKVAQHPWGGPDHHLDVVAEELRRLPVLRDRYAAALHRSVPA